MSLSPEIAPPPPPPPDAAIADAPLEKLSVEAERAMAGALQIAIDTQQPSLGTEHLLLGVLGQESCLGALVLQSLGVTREFVTARLRPRTRPVKTTTPPPIPSGRLVNALMRSMLRSTDTSAIDSGVLVDAVIDGGGGGGQILGEAGVTSEKWQVATSLPGTDLHETALDRFSPAFSSLWTQRGGSRLRMNRLAEARADFVLVLGSATSDIQVGVAANNLAWTELCLGDRDRFRDALELAERAAAKLPGERYVRGTLAFALIENGRIGEGVDMLVTDSIQGEEDWGTAARACVLAIGVARLGHRPYAEVLLNLAEQLGGPSALLARVAAEISKAPSSEPAAPVSMSEGSVAATVESLRLHRKLGKYVVVLRGADRRVYAIWVAAGAADRIRSLIASPKAVVLGRREWIELLLAALRSRGAGLGAISLDREVAGAFRCTVSVTGDGGWVFEVSPSDAAVIALSTGLPIRVSRELWVQYSVTDPSLAWGVKRFFRAIFRRH